MTIENLPTRTALVLAGGGANGAYEVGVLRALCGGRSVATDFRPLEADRLIGTSVGAYNATFLASRPGETLAESVRHLERIWRERIPESPDRWGNGVYRIRADVFELVQPSLFLRHPIETIQHLGRDLGHLGMHTLRAAPRLLQPGAPIGRRLLELLDFSAFVDLSPLHQLALDTIDLDGLSRSRKELAIAATGWSPARPAEVRSERDPPLTRLFSKAELTGGYGIRPILASTAMPGIFPPVEIDGQLYVDGGVAMNIPLPPAAMTDSHSVHVVYPSLDTRTPNQHLQLPSVEAMLRELLMGWQANLAGQLLNIGAWGQIRGRTDDPSALRQIKQFLLEAPVRFAGSGLPHLVTLARRLDFDIHLYTTEQSTKDALGWLDFSEPHIRHLLRMGFDDALHHDCQKAGCLLRRGSSKASDPPADRSAPEARSSLP